MNSRRFGWQLLPARAAVTVLLAAVLGACGSSDAPQVAAPAPKVLAAMTANAAGDQFQVAGLEKIAEVRVSRTVFDYTYRVSVKNTGSVSAGNVLATLTSGPSGTTIVDGSVAAGTIGAGATVTPGTDVIVLRLDRSIAFNPSGLVWKFTAGASIELAAVKPAEVVVLSLADIGLADGADSVLPSGAVSEALIKDGTLRFWTPGDTGLDQKASIAVSNGSAVTTLELLIRSQRSIQPLAHVEPLDDGSLPPDPPVLTVDGFGPNNSITGNGLVFKLQSIPGLDLNDDSDALVTGSNGTSVGLKPFWVYNPADASFSITGAAMQQALSGMPNGTVNMSLNFVSKDGEFAITYDMLAIKQGARLSGKLVNPQGAAVTTLVGKRILLRGFNGQLRATAPIDSNGNFVFEGVIPDTYQLTLNDLANPDVVSASTVILQGTTQATVTMTYSLGALPKALPSQLAAASPSFVASSVVQNGKAGARRQLPEAKALATPAVVTASLAGAQTFSAIASQQNQTITTQIAYIVPRGTKSVGAKVTVFTAEYPTYTTQQSQYNDTWSYSVVGLPGTVLSGSGSVNQSHFTQGSISKTACVDVSKQAELADLSISGAVSATNIGDSVLATFTSVELSLGCVGLKVTSAKFLSPNADAHPVLGPITTTGNLVGPYLSIQQSAADATHTIPFEIVFSPPDAKITEVNIGVSANGVNPSFTTDNLLGQAHTLTAGKIKFSRLSLPVFAGAMSTGKLSVTVRLKGTVEETSTESDPAEGGQVSFDSKTAFTPLYLGNSIAALAARRYGGRDAGGDSWSTRQTLDWLGTKAYRFDDTSGMHVTQTATGRSILEHSGHSDGQQIDLRYADGAGGYSDALGGQGNGAQIQQMINAAAAEVVANPPLKPKLAILQAWITANHALLSLEAAAVTTRRIYIGPSFIKLALIDARFSTTVTIPGVQPWIKPAQVAIDGAHLSHWHLSMTAQP